MIAGFFRLAPEGSYAMDVYCEIRQVKLYSRLTCAQMRSKCKFVSRRLPMIAGFFKLAPEGSYAMDVYCEIRLPRFLIFGFCF